MITTILLLSNDYLRADLSNFAESRYVNITVRKGRRHIFLTWTLLICFAAGQWAVYAHYHRSGFVRADYSKNHATKTTVTETCQLCDAMLHHTVAPQADQVYFVPLTATEYVYKQGRYDFVSIALILSAGRAPPVS